MDVTERAAFLKKIHLFYDLTDEQVLKVAEKFEEISFDTDAVILEQGALADSFYIIYRGKVRVYRHVDEQEEHLAKLVSSDYFGEMEVLEDRGARTASIAALVPTMVLRISGEDFAEIVNTYPTIKPKIEISIVIFYLASATNPSLAVPAPRGHHYRLCTASMTEGIGLIAVLYNRKLICKPFYFCFMPFVFFTLHHLGINIRV